MSPQMQRLLMAAAACCCPTGSGSGSGPSIASCCETFVPTIASWEVTGTSCPCNSGTETAAASPGCEFISDRLPTGYQLRGGSFRIDHVCTDAGSGVSATVVIELCCIEKIADHTQTQLWVYFSIFFDHPLGSVWSRGFEGFTNRFDISNCDAGIHEVIGMPLTQTSAVGSPTCSFTDMKVTLVLT